jgi:hypothetical protein
MEWSSELVFAAAVAVAVFFVGMLWVRARASRTRTRGKGHSGPAPANLRYVCAGCAGRFTHSRRTLATREKGATSFYCNACHTRSIGEGAPPRTRYVPNAKRGKRWWSP